MSTIAPIVTPRLQLVLILPATLVCLSVGDVEEASRTQELDLTSDFLTALDGSFLRRQIAGLTQWSSRQEWFLRAIVRNEDGVVIGQCGFHGVPDDVGRAEIGYTIFEPFRRHRYATGCAQGLVDWAREQGLRSVVAAVSTSNEASLKVVKKLGFQQSGVRVVDPEGEMLDFELRLERAEQVHRSG